MGRKRKRYPQGRKRPKKPLDDPECNKKDWDELRRRRKLRGVMHTQMIGILQREGKD